MVYRQLGILLKSRLWNLRQFQEAENVVKHVYLKFKGEDAKKKKNTLGKTVHCCKKYSEPLCTKYFSKTCPSCWWICELLTLFWLIFVYLCIVSGFVAVICLLPWCFLLFPYNMFLPNSRGAPSKLSE